MMNANTICTPFNVGPPGKLKEIGHENVLDHVLKGLSAKRERLRPKTTDLCVRYERSTDEREAVMVQKLPAHGMHMCYTFNGQDPTKIQEVHPRIEEMANEVLNDMEDPNVVVVTEHGDTSGMDNRSPQIMHRQVGPRQHDISNSYVPYGQFSGNLRPPGGSRAVHVSTPDSQRCPQYAARKTGPRYRKVITSTVVVPGNLNETPKGYASNMVDPLEKAKRDMMKILEQYHAESADISEEHCKQLIEQSTSSNRSNLPPPPNIP